MILHYLALLAGKITLFVSKILKLGAGGTWPGEIGLTIDPKLITILSSQIKQGIIIVAGTNGKTTTSLMINQVLNQSGFKTIHNATGANLLNGIASSLIQNASLTGKVEADFGVFEVDENSLPQLIKELQIYSSSDPSADGESRGKIKVSSRLRSNNKVIILVLLNLFRDQLDRYGEVDVIAEKWNSAMQNIPINSTFILNADDPLIAHLGNNLQYSSRESHPSGANREASLNKSGSSRHRSNDNIIYFGINDPKQFIPKLEHATDSIFCLNCGGRLNYSGIYFSHLGIWQCDHCGEKRPQPDISNWPSTLPGLYNKYNTLAAVSVGHALGIENNLLRKALQDFTPAFGRQEEFEVESPTLPSGLRGASKKIKIFLAKNPAGFNASLRTVLEQTEESHPRFSRGSISNLDSRFRGNDGVILLVLNDRIPDGRDVSWIWDVDMETIPSDMNVIVSGDRAYDMGLRMKYSLLVHKVSKVRKVESIIIEPNLKIAINEGLKLIKNNETLYILPTYSAMLEVRKILSGRKIL